MFLHTVDENETHTVIADERNGSFLLFVRSDALESSEPHWVGEMTDQRTLGVVSRWFAARRDRWQQWGAVAEMLGGAEFALYMRELMANEPLEEAVGRVMSFSADSQELTLGEMLVSSRGSRTEELYRHRFSSPAAGKAFRRWFNTGRNFEQVEALADVGYARGATAMAEALDRLAEDASDKQGRRDPSNRRRAQRAVAA